MNPAPLTLTISSGERSTGQQLTVTTGFHSPFARPSPGDTTLSQQLLFCKFVIQDNTGRVRWENETGSAMRSFGTVGENPQAELRNEMENGFQSLLQGGFAQSALPNYVFAKLEEILPGARPSLSKAKPHPRHHEKIPPRRTQRNTEKHGANADSSDSVFLRVPSVFSVVNLLRSAPRNSTNTFNAPSRRSTNVSKAS